MSIDDLGVMIGLEVHTQLTVLKTKLFCSCNADYRGAEPNTFTCPTCLGLPGTLPVLNEKALEFAIKLSLALDSKINKYMYFFRKNYFYPDMAKNFQITMYNKAGGVAFADGGVISMKVNGEKKDIRINRLHLEEDPGRLVHQGSIRTSPYTLVDYNRHGVTLIEIVSEPDLESPAEAREYLNKLKLIISYIGIANLELDGSCRVDANISLTGGKRVEVKNINSFVEVEKALNHEILRQKTLLKRGKVIMQETRHWDDVRGITTSLRQKEEEMDYRYFPEQDLVPFEILEEQIEDIKNLMPELPDAKKIRFKEQYKLSKHNVDTFPLDKEMCDFFEVTTKINNKYSYKQFQDIANWLIGDIKSYLNDNNIGINDSKLTPLIISELVDAINENIISGKIAKTFIPEIMNGVSVKKLIEKTGKKITDESDIEKVCSEVISENPEIIKDLDKNPKAFEALIGKCMQKTKGKLDPEKTRGILKDLLAKK